MTRALRSGCVRWRSEKWLSPTGDPSVPRNLLRCGSGDLGRRPMATRPSQPTQPRALTAMHPPYHHGGTKWNSTDSPALGTKTPREPVDFVRRIGLAIKSHTPVRVKGEREDQPSRTGNSGQRNRSISKASLGRDDLQPGGGRGALFRPARNHPFPGDRFLPGIGSS